MRHLIFALGASRMCASVSWSSAGSSSSAVPRLSGPRPKGRRGGEAWSTYCTVAMTSMMTVAMTFMMSDNDDDDHRDTAQAEQASVTSAEAVQSKSAKSKWW